MKLTRIVFVAFALLLPVSWTVAKAEDTTPPAGETTPKKEKKAKKSKKAADAPAGDEKKDMK